MGTPRQTLCNCQSRYLTRTHSTTHPLGQGMKLHLLQYVYHQFQLEIILKQHQELGGMASNPYKMNAGS